MAVPGNPAALEALQTIEYRNSVDFEMNEKPGKFDPLAGSQGSGSSSKLVEIKQRFDDVDVQEKTGRNVDTVNTDVDVSTRWIAKPPLQFVAPLIDREDILTTKMDPTSPIVEQTGKAIRRARGIRFLQGFYGNALVGGDESALTSVPFKSANIMAADKGEAADSGMTLNKLIAMLELAREALVDLEEEQLMSIITAKQISDLLKINEMRSRDYNPMLAQALQTGKPSDFMGIHWIPAQIGNTKAFGTAAPLTVNGSNYRRVPFFVKSGIHRESWEELFARVTERPDKHYNSQVYASTVVAFTRLNEDKCFQMLCKEV